MVDMMVDVVSYNDADIILNNELDPAMPEQIGLRALSRIIIINYCLHLYFQLRIGVISQTLSFSLSSFNT